MAFFRLIDPSQSVERELALRATQTAETGAISPADPLDDGKQDADAQREDLQDRYEPAGAGDRTADFTGAFFPADFLSLTELPSHPGQLYFPGMEFIALRQLSLIPRAQPQEATGQLFFPGMPAGPEPGVLPTGEDGRGRQFDMEG